MYNQFDKLVEQIVPSAPRKEVAYVKEGEVSTKNPATNKSGTDIEKAKDTLKDCYKKAEEDYWKGVNACKDTFAKEAAEVIKAHNDCLDLQKQAQQKVDDLVKEKNLTNCFLKVIRVKCKDALPLGCTEPPCPREVELIEPDEFRFRPYVPEGMPSCETNKCGNNPGGNHMEMLRRSAMLRRYRGGGGGYPGAPARGPMFGRRGYLG